MSHLKSLHRRMLHLDIVNWPGSFVLHIQSDDLGCCLLFAVLFPSFLKRTTSSSSSSVECWPNQTGLKLGLLGRLNCLPAVWLHSKRLSACVYLILLLLCVFAYLTAELPLTVLYLSLPLRKLLQYLWLCNSECVSVCVCMYVYECLRVCLWMQGSGISSTHLTYFFSCFT